MKPKFLVLSGDGINCETETAFSLKNSGALTEIVHINELCLNPKKLLEFQGLALPGGFSFGDELGSGKLLALKIKNSFIIELKEFLERKNPIIGICNGFQVLTQLGLLPHINEKRTVSLVSNIDGEFIDRWVHLEKNSKCESPWLSMVNSKIFLPIRHAEGRIIIRDNDDSLYQSLYNSGQVALTYDQDINGSYKKIAALTDPTGLILGLMPHPEAAYFKMTAIDIAKDKHHKADGALLFDSIIDFIKNK